MLGILIDALRIAVNTAAHVPTSRFAGCAPRMALIARIMCPALACLVLTPLTTSAMIASEREGSILIGDALNAAVVDRRVQSKRVATEPRLADVLCALVREGQGGLRSRCDVRRFDTQDAWWKSLQRRETQIAVVRSDQQYRVQTEELARAAQPQCRTWLIARLVLAR